MVLDCPIGLGFEAYHLEQMMQRAGRRDRPFDIQPPFQVLTAFVSSHDMYSPSTSFIASLLKLPAIKEISGRFVNKWDIDLGEAIVTDKSLVELDSASSPLTSLDLAANTISLSTANLGHMLRAPTALQTFCYKIRRPTYINFTDTCHALRPQMNSLESLGLDCGERDGCLYRLNCIATLRPNNFLGPMTSFASFSNLKVLKIAALFLTTVDIGTERHSLIDFFPPSLETLHLAGFQALFESLLGALEHLLAQNSPQQIPSLKKLILEYYEPFHILAPILRNVHWRNKQERAMGKLFRVAAARGVSIEGIDHFIW